MWFTGYGVQSTIISWERSVMARKRSQMVSYHVSAIVGCVLLGIALAGVVWIVVGQQGGAIGAGIRVLWPQQAAPVVQIPVLQAHGITLAEPQAEASLSQQEALLIASQREPDAVSARSVNSRYELVSSTMAQAKLQNAPTWIIWYQGIASSASGAHDLYIFLDANSGAELFALRT
jgi:hypothetical protein